MSINDIARMGAVVALELCAMAFAYAGLGLVHFAQACGKVSAFIDPRPPQRR